MASVWLWRRPQAPTTSSAPCSMAAPRSCRPPRARQLPRSGSSTQPCAHRGRPHHADSAASRRSPGNHCMPCCSPTTNRPGSAPANGGAATSRASGNANAACPNACSSLDAGHAAAGRAAWGDADRNLRRQPRPVGRADHGGTRSSGPPAGSRRGRIGRAPGQWPVRSGEHRHGRRHGRHHRHGGDANGYLWLNGSRGLVRLGSDQLRAHCAAGSR